ncbi:MAG: transcriptional regulator [Pusillimonas sp.]|jgi:ArsR family transcriptional regulator|nr:transcriptional regulator [Pusillimonas sp.]
MSAMNELAILKCLADETRLRMLLLISTEGELCVCELMSALSEGQSKISRHLAQLKRSGLLSDRRKGQWVFYDLNKSVPTWVVQLLKGLAANQPQLEADRSRLVRASC